MKKHILVCDDDVGILDIISIILDEKGYAVIALSDSEQVVATVIHKKPDVILLDLSMPAISGDEITRRLKSDPATASIPIIISSANKDTEKIAQEAGANNFILKPFDIEELEKMVDQYT